MKSVAIVGAGFAGLAVCWHLLQQKAKVTIFDSTGIGAMASGVSAGLLHPFTGQEARLAWHGHEGLAATQELLEIASKTLGQPVASQKGVLRVAVTDRQRTHFFERSQHYPELRWLTPEDTQSLIPSLVAAPGLLISEGILVNSALYLKGLWQACASLGAQLRIETIDDLNTLKDFDSVVLTPGSLAVKFPQLAHLPIQLLKGQVIELAWPKGLPPLPLPINSEAYLIPNSDRSSILIGATFERTFEDEETDPDFAESVLRPKAEALIPALKGAPLLACRAGIRATTPSHRPIAIRLNERLWLLTALGSKGLLHHAYLAKTLVQDLIQDRFTGL